MKKLLSLLVFLICLSTLVSHGQDFRTGVSSSYWKDMSSATDITPVGVYDWDYEGDMYLDHYESSSHPIGFTFYYGSSAFTQFSASENGIFHLGSSVINFSSNNYSRYDTPFNSSNADFGATKILGVGRVMWMCSGGLISYKVFGTAPNRTFVCQFKLHADCEEPYEQWQIQLEEGTNYIRIVYGSNPSYYNYPYQIGASDGTNGNTFTINPETNQLSNGYSDTYFTSLPNQYRYFQFKAPECALYATADANGATIYRNGGNGRTRIPISSLTNIVIPSSVMINGRNYPVTKIGSSAFAGSAINSITIPESVTEIGSGAFSDCTNLTQVSIPSSVTAIKNWAFGGCNSLRRIDYSGTTGQWSTINFDGVDANPLYRAHNLYINDQLVTTIDIPDNVSSISQFAFAGCTYITSVTIGSGVTTMGDRSFLGCENVVSLTYNARNATFVTDNSLPSYPTATSGFSFMTRMESVVVGDGVQTLPAYSFSNLNNLTSVTLPNSLTQIPHYAFYYCRNLAKIDIPTNVTRIGASSFKGCSALTSIVLPNSIKGQGLTEVIGSKAFQYCTNLSTVILPDSIVGIPSLLFDGCTSLTNIVLPRTVQYIQAQAFNGCSNLSSITTTSQTRDIHSYAFDNCSKFKTIYNYSDYSGSSITASAYSSNVRRVVPCSKSGTRGNALYKITDNTNYHVVDQSESDIESRIPKADLPDNFIYQDQGAWKAKNIVLVDDTCRFFSPVPFMADQVTYTRDLTDGNRSTLCLPFDADKPDGLDVYTFAGFENSTQTSAGTIRFQELQGNVLSAYTPYLVGKNLSKSTTNFTFSKQDAFFPATPTPIATSTINGLTFHGTMKRECMNSTNYGYKDGFFVQSTNGNNEDPADHAHVNPFRCYFTLGGSQSAPATLSVDTDGDYLGIEDVDSDMEQTSIRYSNDVYDMMGRLVRKDAESLRGLPKGIYIWRGKKQIAY